MHRKLTLSKGAYLWEEGDQARNIAVLESGKLAIRSNSRLLGIVLPRMVVGEGAIARFGVDNPSGVSNGNGNHVTRTASAIALEEDTVVSEYTPQRIKHAYDAEDPSVGKQVLTTIMGQTFRNLLLLTAGRKEENVITMPAKGLLNGLVKTVPELDGIAAWPDFLKAFHFLNAVRDTSQSMRAQFTGEAHETTLNQATESMNTHFGGQDILPTLQQFLQAEKERAEWLEVYE